MESKYYTPSIEEFHAGFEFESNYILFNNGKPGDEFVPAILTEDNISWMLQSYFEDATPTEFRVKYLDKEDIEELGWQYLIEGQYRRIDDKEDYVILVDDDFFLQVIYENPGNDDIYLFQGTIKNKSELKVLLKQLGINE